MRHGLLLVSLLLSTAFAWAQTASPWLAADVTTLTLSPEQVVHNFASDFRLVRLADPNLANRLVATDKQVIRLALPLPDGGETQVQLRATNTMAPALAARFPGIRTYRILPKGNVLGGVLSWTHLGLNATLHTQEGTIYLDPYIVGATDFYTVYRVQDNINPDLWAGFSCSASGDHRLDPNELFPPLHDLDRADHNKDLLGQSLVQRKYRLAVACTGEFSEFYAAEAGQEPSVAISLSAIVAIVNRVNEVVGVEVAVQFELVENNDELISLDPDSDVFDDLDTDQMLAEVDRYIDRTIGAANFDIGHVIGVGPARVGQGIALTPSVCSSNKGEGVSTRRNPINDPFTINILCHELGHQMGATHVMSSCQNVQFQTAVEPGSGSTIMGYAGICGDNENIQMNSDPYFNTVSLGQIFSYMREDFGDACGTRIDEENTIPEVTTDYEDGFFVPISTPFELVAQGSDMEGDALTYTWEQIDRSPSQSPPGSPAGNIPIFRSLPPSPDSNRVFPRLNRIVRNITGNFVDEVLPTYDRDLTFRCTVRDNHPTSGGASWTTVAFAATESAGPFRVTAPNTGDESWAVGDFVEVTWNVANTDNAIVDCQRVNIRLSTDGGFTYPIMLLENTANDGSAFVTVPDAVGDEVRVRIDAADNVFFDISNADFSIVPASSPGYTVSYGPQYQKVCIPEEEAVIDFSTGSVLDFTEALTFEVISDLPAGVSATFDANELTPGGSTVLRLNFAESTFDGLFTVEVRTIAAGVDTTFRNFDVETISKDFSAFALLTPVPGETGIVANTEFSWNTLPNVESYDFQLATSPDFSAPSIVFEANDLTTSTLLPQGLQLDNNTLFFWRMRPKNECRTGAWSIPSVFQTELVSCQTLEAAGLPITIPNTGPLATIVSPIAVDFSGSINDVNLPLLNIRYGTQFYSLTLRSPQQTEVLLYESGFCFDGNLLNIGFDSESPVPLNCEEGNEPMLANQTVRQPIESLGAFDTEETQGTWELELKVAQQGFSTGSLQSWNIEFCAATEALELALLENDTLRVPPGQSNPLSNDLLRIEDTQQTLAADEILYTIVALPEHGTLTNFFGEELTVGSSFTQAAIDALNIRYTHDDSDTMEDAFFFIARDGNGALWPTERFVIIIDDQAVVNTDELSPLQDLRLFPNPASATATVQLGAALDYDLPLQVYDLQGRLLLQTVLPQGSIQQLVDVSRWPAGAYILRAGAQNLRLIVE